MPALTFSSLNMLSTEDAFYRRCFPLHMRYKIVINKDSRAQATLSTK